MDGGIPPIIIRSLSGILVRLMSGSDGVLISSSLTGIALHQWTVLAQNPWVDDISKRNVFDYNILLHTSEAEKKGSRRRFLWIESETNRVKGRVRVTECVHPDVWRLLPNQDNGPEQDSRQGQGGASECPDEVRWNMVDTLSAKLTTAQGEGLQSED
jgi:hypothetical protein